LVEKAGCFVPVERLAGKIVSEMIHNVSSGTLNPTELNLIHGDRLSFQVDWSGPVLEQTNSNV